jgi:hypothetical protein
MRPFAAIPLAAAVVAACSSAWGYAPQCNITRGIYVDARPLLTSAYWGEFGDGFAFTDAQAHSGRWSVKCINPGGPKSGAGIAQTVQLNQTAAAPLKVSGWSKAEGVAGAEKAWTYSLYVDLRYTDGTGLYMQIAPFSGGTHDWEYAEATIKPEKPLASATFYAFVRERAGIAYFDDLFLGSPGGANLLHNAGFEPDDREDRASRDRVYSTFADLNANAMHTYLSGDPQFWTGRDNKGNAQVRDFLALARSHGMGVWLTTGEPPAPAFKDADDPNFPQYVCVNGRWGQAWTDTVALAAAYDFAGISLVPDEYNWLNDALKDSFAKHPDPRVADFYKRLPSMCDCPDCQRLYQAQFGEKLPALGPGVEFPSQDPAYLHYLKHRYDSTTNWLARSAAAVHQANPRIRADSLICVTPLCSDFWWGPGLAWDRVGYETQIDFPTTDPYIQLHNYLGDSTHWYVTETAAHLTGSTPKRQCGIVLEACRLDKSYVEKDPVEIYGSALSAVAHGAKELAWWHYSHLVNEAPVTDRPEVSRACVRGVYGILKDADPWLGDLKPLKRVALLYSRASDDTWRFYTEGTPSSLLTHPVKDVRYSSIAQKEVLYYLFRRGVPTDLYYLDAVQESQLADYPVIVAPFPFAVGDAQAQLLEKLARSGKTVIVVSEFGALDEMGLPRKRATLLGLLGLQGAPSGEVRGTLTGSAGIPASGETFGVYERLTVASGAKVLAAVQGHPAVIEHPIGKGKVLYLAGTFGYDLVANRDNQKATRTQRIIPDPIATGHAAVFDALLRRGFADEPWALKALAPGKDVEAACLTNSKGENVVLAINWENTGVNCTVQVPRKGTATLSGYRIGPDGRYEKFGLALTAMGQGYEGQMTLGPQEACLLHH